MFSSSRLKVLTVPSEVFNRIAFIITTCVEAKIVTANEVSTDTGVDVRNLITKTIVKMNSSSSYNFKEDIVEMNSDARAKLFNYTFDLLLSKIAISYTKLRNEDSTMLNILFRDAEYEFSNSESNKTYDINKIILDHFGSEIRTLNSNENVNGFYMLYRLSSDKFLVMRSFIEISLQKEYDRTLFNSDGFHLGAKRSTKGFSYEIDGTLHLFGFLNNTKGAEMYSFPIVDAKSISFNGVMLTMSIRSVPHAKHCFMIRVDKTYFFQIYLKNHWKDIYTKISTSSYRYKREFQNISIDFRLPEDDQECERFLEIMYDFIKTESKIDPDSEIVNGFRNFMISRAEPSNMQAINEKIAIDFSHFDGTFFDADFNRTKDYGFLEKTDKRNGNRFISSEMRNIFGKKGNNFNLNNILYKGIIEARYDRFYNDQIEG